MCICVCVYVYIYIHIYICIYIMCVCFLLRDAHGIIRETCTYMSTSVSVWYGVHTYLNQKCKRRGGGKFTSGKESWQDGPLPERTDEHFFADSSVRSSHQHFIGLRPTDGQWLRGLSDLVNNTASEVLLKKEGRR
jgi:hypothetical protein